MRIQGKMTAWSRWMTGIAEACLNGAGHMGNIPKKCLVTTAYGDPPVNSVSPPSLPSLAPTTVFSPFCGKLSCLPDNLKSWASGKEYTLCYFDSNMKHSYTNKTTISAWLLFTCGTVCASHYWHVYHSIPSVRFLCSVSLLYTAPYFVRLRSRLLLQRLVNCRGGSCRSGSNTIKGGSISG